MLDRIDPYGDLELVSSDMPQVLGELSQVAAAATNDAERDVVDDVREMAEECSESRAAILLFQGD